MKYKEEIRFWLLMVLLAVFIVLMAIIYSLLFGEQVLYIDYLWFILIPLAILIHYARKEE